MRYRHDLDISTPECVSYLGQPDVALVQSGHRKQVVGDEPLTLVDLPVEGEDDNRPGCHTSCLGEAREGVAPMVDGEKSGGGIEATVGEGQGLGDSPHHRCRPRRSLGDHPPRRLHGDHGLLCRFVGPAASTHVQHAPCASEVTPDVPFDPGVGAPRAPVADPDRLVDRSIPGSGFHRRTLPAGVLGFARVCRESFDVKLSLQ